MLLIQPRRTSKTLSRRFVVAIIFTLILAVYRSSRWVEAFRTLSLNSIASQKAGFSQVSARKELRAINMSLENKPLEHAPKDLIPDWMLAERTRILTPKDIEPSSSKEGKGSVVYWMQRDVRAKHNWALAWASHLAASRRVPLRVLYALQPPPSKSGNSDDNLPPHLVDLPMTERHGMFLLGGLELVHEELEKENIPLDVVMAKSHNVVGETVCQTLLEKCQAEVVVCDFSPIRHYRQWMELQAAPILANAGVPMYQVDTHNCVPVWIATDKRQVGARTLRPRIHRVITDYLQGFPKLKRNKQDIPLPDFDRSEYESFLQMNESVGEVEWAKPGTDAALKQFDFFVKHGLKHFDELRNDPTKKNILSNLSPWINHGHVSFQHLTMEVKKLNKYANGTKAFIEEGVIRRELSDNFLYYSPNDYDSLDTAAGWAQETLQTHASDKREYVYSLQELEDAETHEDIWNAAQLQLVQEGKLHGFMRMYWAKKILEWTDSPEVALRTAQYLNDKYALDGRDPNGFTGVGWSVIGIHDQGWKEREVFGKIRYMNYNGCKRKFNVKAFVDLYKGAAENASKAAKKHGSKKRPSSAKESSSKKKQKA